MKCKNLFCCAMLVALISYYSASAADSISQPKPDSIAPATKDISKDKETVLLDDVGIKMLGAGESAKFKLLRIDAAKSTATFVNSDGAKRILATVSIKEALVKKQADGTILNSYSTGTGGSVTEIGVMKGDTITFTPLPSHSSISSPAAPMKGEVTAQTDANAAVMQRIVKADSK